MDLRQLHTFVQVAELGSLSKAAERLRIAQPALSRQMRMLEQELNVALFTRHGRGMALTPAGGLLCDRAAGILRQIEATRTDLTREAGAVQGHVVFGMPPTVGDVLATRLIDRFLGLHPLVTLRVVTAYSGYLLDWLHSGRIDIAVVYSLDKASDIHVAPLVEESLSFITQPGTAKERCDIISFETLARHRLVLPGPQHGLRVLIDREARRRELALDVVVETDSLQIQKSLVMRGLGATILPLPAVHAEVSAGRLHAAAIVDPPLRRRLALAQPLGRPASNAVRRFAELVKSEMHDLAAFGAGDGPLP